MEVHDLKVSARIWESLQTRFQSACLARSMELKRLLSHIKKKENQTIDQYLLEIKILADSLSLINSPVSNKDLIEYAINGLGPAYESLITAVTYFPGDATIESLRPILLAQEQRNILFSSQDPQITHQAFAAARGGPPVDRGGAARGQGGRLHGNRGNRGGRGRGQRGRGRGYGQNFQNQQGNYVQNFPPPQQPGYPHGQQPYGAPRGQFPSGNSGFPSVDNSYQSHPPPVVCQICFS
ncbi:unnamed protein product, partial [Cuscuta epithymum]